MLARQSGWRRWRYGGQASENLFLTARLMSRLQILNGVRMKKITFVVLMTSLVTGCAATVTPMKTPEGNQGFLVECDGSASSWAACYESASKSCQKPYRVLDRNESVTPTGLGPLVRRNLIIECK